MHCCGAFREADGSLLDRQDLNNTQRRCVKGQEKPL